MSIDDSTMFLGVYGSLVRHPWVAVDTDADAYVVFNEYAESYLWSDSTGRPSNILWGMNDAGQNWDADGGRLSWFQTALPGRAPVVRPGQTARIAPIIPLSLCAERTISRFGTLVFAGVQFLIPRNTAAPNVPRHAAALRPPQPRTTVDVEITDGAGGLVVGRAEEALAALRTGPSRARTFDVQSWDVVADARPMFAEDAMDRRMWLGEASAVIRARLMVDEFTLEAATWTIAQVVDGLRAAGIDSSVLVSMRTSHRRAATTVTEPGAISV